VRVITDSAAQFDATRAAGKLGSALTGAWPAADVQIGELLGSAASGGAPSGAVTTLVNHLGISACDLVLADLLLTRAEESGSGILLQP
jgi:ornithine cyclodeaminase/alanine dehydrogenase-like protein (mu-crystallin family)